MAQLPLSFVSEAKVLAFAQPPRTSAGSQAPVASLSDAELLERLLDPPSKARPDPLVIAEQLLGGSPSARGLVELLDLAPEQLARLGLSAEAASRLLAAVEIARRLAWREVPEQELLSDPGAVARYLFLRYARIDQEVFGAILLNSANRWIADFEVARGTIRQVAVEPRQVLTQALLRGATGVILFHNHPSTNPTPSEEDYAVTRLFCLAGEAVGVRLVDHLVLGSASRWASIRDRRPW